jgi:hypothetical protein
MFYSLITNLYKDIVTNVKIKAKKKNIFYSFWTSSTYLFTSHIFRLPGAKWSPNRFLVVLADENGTIIDFL